MEEHKEVLKQFIIDANNSPEVSQSMKDFITNEYSLLVKIFNIIKVNI